MDRPDRTGLLLRGRLAARLSGLFGCATGLVVVTWLVYEVPPAANFDLRILNRLLPLGQTGFVAGSGRALVHLGDPAAAFAVMGAAGAAAIFRGRPRPALAAFLLVAGASATTLALKGLLAHPRPDPALGEHQIVATALPSGHSTALAAVAFALVLASPPSWRPVMIVLAGGVALLGSFALIFLGDHFPSDVLAGWLVAGGWLGASLSALALADASRRRAGRHSLTQPPPSPTGPGG